MLDVCSRRAVGWCIGQTLHADQVLATLNMALAQRKAHDLVYHSHQRSHCNRLAFGRRCQEMGTCPSMGSLGDA